MIGSVLSRICPEPLVGDPSRGDDAVVSNVTNIEDSPKLRRRRVVYQQAALQLLRICYVARDGYRDVASFLETLDDKAPTDDDARRLGAIMQERAS
jgi:hypothetical protein